MAVSCALHKRSGSLGCSHWGKSAHTGPEVELPQVLLVKWPTTGVESLPTGSSKGGLGEPQGMGQVAKKIQIPGCSALPLSLPSILGQLQLATVQVSLKISQDNPHLHPPPCFVYPI